MALIGKAKMKTKTVTGGNAKKHSFVDTSLQVNGKLRLNGDMEVTGIIEGTILADPESDAFLGIRTGGCVKGTVHVPFMIVNGIVEGTVYCAKHLEVAPGGVLKGDIYYNELIVANGAQLNGRLTYLEDDKISFEDVMRDSGDRSSASATAPKPGEESKAPQPMGQTELQVAQEKAKEDARATSKLRLRSRGERSEGSTESSSS